MKRVLVLALGVFALTQAGFSASCVTGSLASYVALGAGGCTIGGDTVSNFQLLNGAAFSTAIPGTAVTITPTGSTYNPGLAIMVNQTASDPTILESIFTYKLSATSVIQALTALSGASETGGGTVTGTVNICAGGAFGPDGVSNCSGINGALITDDGVQQSDSTSFAKSTFVNVTDDFVIDGTGGTASAGTLTNIFVNVPEPVSFVLTGFGLAFAAAYRRRNKSNTAQL